MSSKLAIIERASIMDAPPADPVRPHSLTIAASLLAAGSALALFTLIAIYLGAREGAVAANTEWITSGALPLTGPNVALFTLLLSIPVMAWAQYSLANDDRQNLWVAFGIVLLLGVAFINAQSFVLASLTLVNDSGEAIGISESIPGLLIFTIVGAHIVMVGASMVSILLTAFRTLGGQLSSTDRDGVTAVALYWYVTVAAFAVLWFVIYVTK